MKKIVLTIVLAAASLLSSNVYAAKVKCTPAKFENLLARDGVVYIQLQGQSWHVLGREGDNDLDKKMRKIERAKRKDRYLQLVFPNGYHDSCMIMDEAVTVKNVKVKKHIDEPDNDEDDS